jgi:3-methyladenine DNA glycosylase AlkD
MAAAWLLSMCYIKFPNETTVYLQKSKLDDYTYNKSIQKITESNKIDKETKTYVKTLKRQS